MVGVDQELAITGNSCFCDNGMLSCTELACETECEVDLDNDGICDEIDNCIGTWTTDFETGNCDQFTSQGQDVCSSYSDVSGSLIGRMAKL